jgi:RHS repeat-associated protein
VDYVQWTGPLPQDPPTDAWRELTYVYDASGRRIEKRYDGLTILKYIYDGDHCIAEYDAGGNLRRKYIYGPGIDQPVCMIEATATPAATYYYHFDASGSVVALTNSDANTVEVYEYSVYGQVGATDPSHTNRFMFTGREYDKETGLYYYRARYYKPEIGRFLQADNVGYRAGMNLYRYCRNNPWNRVDPFGLADTNEFVDSNGVYDPCDPCDPCDCYDPCGVLDEDRPFDPSIDIIGVVADAGPVPDIMLRYAHLANTTKGMEDASSAYSNLSGAINTTELDTSNIFALTNGRGNDVWCVRHNFQAAAAAGGYVKAGAMQDTADYVDGKAKGGALKKVCGCAGKIAWKAYSSAKKVCQGISDWKNRKKSNQPSR